MKLIIDIKDHKAIFFLELMNSFKDFVKIQEAGSEEESLLSEEHKAILDARLSALEDSSGHLTDWGDFLADVEVGL